MGFIDPQQQGTSSERLRRSVTDARWSNGHVTTLIPIDPDYRLQDLTTRTRHFSAAVLAVVAVALAACDGPRRSRASNTGEESSAPYQSEVEEGFGAAVAILIDTSRSMREEAPGDSRPKAAVARRHSRRCSTRPSRSSPSARLCGKVGIYSFSSDASTVLPMQAFDRAAIRDALARAAARRQHRHRRGYADGGPTCIAPAYSGSIYWSSPTARTRLDAARTRSPAKFFRRASRVSQYISWRSTRAPNGSRS